MSQNAIEEDEGLEKHVKEMNNKKPRSNFHHDLPDIRRDFGEMR